MSVHDILTTAAALAAVIVMILLIRHGSRFTGLIQQRNRTQGVLMLAASVSLDPRRRLSLVTCQGHQLLLLTGGPSDMLLGWLPPVAPFTDERP